MQTDLRLAKADNRQARLEMLADLADDLDLETRALGRTASMSDLIALARLYAQVVRQGLVSVARDLPSSLQSQCVRPIADRLARTGEAADILARNAAPEAAKPFQIIAAAAHEVDAELRALARESRP
jgi:hypothetical protein